ncbi:hypothetical protein KRX53_02615 [Dermabacteraceae bacterium TAE3-ERU5]|nr:hypothetical protein [Dermabacteraceae bacterium TAE3-ERU5]
MADNAPVSAGKKPQLLLIAALLAVIAALLLVIAWLLAAGNGEPEASAGAGDTHAAPEAPAVQTAAAEEDLSALQVTAGKGGTKVSPIDGMTQIGYPQTCTGAVAAATNYLNDLDITRITSGEVTTDQFAKLYFDRTRLPKEERDRAVFDDKAFKEAAKIDNTRAIWRPEWGGFKVISCTPGEKADIALLHAASADRKKFTYFADISRMVWVDGDWRYVSSETIPEPVANVPGTTTKRLESVQKEMEEKDGWTRYQNPVE